MLAKVSPLASPPQLPAFPWACENPARASHRQQSFNPPQHRGCALPSRMGRSHTRSRQRASSSVLFPWHSLASGCLHSQPQMESEILVQFFPVVNTVQGHSDFSAGFLSAGKGAQKLHATSAVGGYTSQEELLEATSFSVLTKWPGTLEETLSLSTQSRASGKGILLLVCRGPAGRLRACSVSR